MPPAIGGMASVVRDLSESVLREEFVVVPFDTGKQTPQGRSILAAIGARLALWRRWLHLLGADVPTVAHIHTCSGLSYFLDGVLVILARVRGVPVVLHIHGGSFDTFMDALGRVPRAIARAVARRAAHVVVLSEIWRERLGPRLPGARLHVVENGVPAVGLEPNVTAAKQPVVLFVGSLCGAKGVQELVRAFAKLVPHARLVCVGPESEPGYLAFLQSLAAGLGVGDRVSFPGPASPEVVRAWLNRATMFVLPSHIEGMPLVLLEAMAAGLPVVATPVGAVPSVVEQDRFGYLVPVGDVDALAAALGRLLADEGLRQRFGQTARATWAARFSIERVAQDLRCLYGGLFPAGAIR
jgi:glycosyltransferase involved in cell wall biosynthesis